MEESNLRKPIIENIIHFLKWIPSKMRDDEDFIKLREMGITFSKELFIEFFGIFLHKDTYEKCHRKANDEVKEMVELNVYDRYEHDEILKAFDKILEENNFQETYLFKSNPNSFWNYNSSEQPYSFINDGNIYYSDIINFITYAALEELFEEYFDTTIEKGFCNIGNKKFHKDSVERTFKYLRKASTEDYPSERFEELFKELVPENGIAPTKAGEYIRALMKILYHLYNDGDNPVTYGYRKVSFWSYVNCMYVINKNYSLFKECFVAPNYSKSSIEIEPEFYTDNDLCPFNLMSMIKFGIKYSETEEGKSENKDSFYDKVDNHYYNEGYFNRYSYQEY